MRFKIHDIITAARAALLKRHLQKACRANRGNTSVQCAEWLIYGCKFENMWVVNCKKTVQTMTTFRSPLADPLGTRRAPPLVSGLQFDNRWSKECAQSRTGCKFLTGKGFKRGPPHGVETTFSYRYCKLKTVVQWYIAQIEVGIR